MPCPYSYAVDSIPLGVPPESAIAEEAASPELQLDPKVQIPFFHTPTSTKSLLGPFAEIEKSLLGTELSQLIHTLKWAGMELESHIFDRNGVSTVLEKTEQAFKTLDLVSLPAMEVDPAQKKAVQIDPNLKGFSPFDLYDQYMRIVRLEEMSPGQFIRQNLETCAWFVQELASSPVSNYEISRALLGMKIILEDCRSSSGKAVVPSSPGKPLEATPSTTACLATNAYRRWIIAHQAFALAMVFSTYHLDQAIALLDQSPDEAARELELAADLLRMATTATLCGASMPPAIYQNVIRPSMSSTAMPNGFSGTQNPDFSRWKKSKDQLRRMISEGTEITHPALRKAIRYFRSLYLEDMEQHIQVATALVGRKPSLLQEQISHYLPKEKQESNGAIEILRKILRIRYNEFNISFLKN